MAWRDREYARESDYSRSFRPGSTRNLFAGKSIVTILIWVNIAIYLACIMTGGGPEPVIKSPVADVMVFHTHSIMHGQVWRMITSQYVHWTSLHILVNMLGLFFLAKQLERDWGQRQFIAIYTISGLIGNILLLLLTLKGWFDPGAPAAGASGCILGLLGAAAVRYPHAEVRIYFLFPIKIRTAALIFAGLYVLNIWKGGANAGGDVCHVAGLAFGAWWAYRGQSWYYRRGWHWPRFRSRKPYRRPSPIGATFQDRVRQRQDDAVTVDRILKKVYESGIHSLTEAEKQALREATERQKAMES